MHHFYVNKRRDRLREIRDTLKPLNWILAIFSLNCKQKKLQKCSSLIKKLTLASILAILNIYTFHIKILYLYSRLNVSIAFTNIVQSILDLCQYIIDLYFVNKYEREINLEYYQNYKHIDDIIDMNYYSDIKKRIKILIGFFITIWMMSSVIDLWAWSNSYGTKASLMFAISFLFLLIKILTTIDLTAQVIQIECRLRVIGNMLQDFYKMAEIPELITMPNINTDFNKNKSDLLKSSSQTWKKKDSFMDVHHYHEMKWLSRCYLLLTKQCAFINGLFGIRVR